MTAKEWREFKIRRGVTEGDMQATMPRLPVECKLASRVHPHGISLAQDAEGFDYVFIDDLDAIALRNLLNELFPAA